MEKNTKQYMDKNIQATNGFLAFILMIVAFLVFIASFIAFFFINNYLGNLTILFIGVISFIAGCVFIKGICIIEPNQAMLLQFFGQYSGTVRNTGLVFINPLMRKRLISTKLENFSNKPIKVNDKRGNPIILSAMIAWRINDCAKVAFMVKHYQDFLHNQVEGILASTASLYPFDSEDNEVCFRKNIEQIASVLQQNLQQRVSECGLEIIDVRFNHYAYSVEIASAMLKKQQAEATVDARKKIVEGAHAMTTEIINKLEEDKNIKFSNEDKVKLATNLMTVLVSESGTQPVVNV